MGSLGENVSHGRSFDFDCSRLGRRSSFLRNSGIQGTYINENAIVTLEIKGGGQASLTIDGAPLPCTYKQDAAKLTMICSGVSASSPELTVTYQIHVLEDGSLTCLASA